MSALQGRRLWCRTLCRRSSHPRLARRRRLRRGRRSRRCRWTPRTRRRSCHGSPRVLRSSRSTKRSCRTDCVLASGQRRAAAARCPPAVHPHPGWQPLPPARTSEASIRTCWTHRPPFERCRYCGCVAVTGCGCGCGCGCVIRVAVWLCAHSWCLHLLHHAGPRRDPLTRTASIANEAAVYQRAGIRWYTRIRVVACRPCSGRCSVGR